VSTIQDTIVANARAIEAAGTGYSQPKRWSFLDKARRAIAGRKNADCSSFTGGALFLSGLLTQADISGTFYTGNMAGILVKRGFTRIPFKSKSQLRKGDVLLSTRGHVEIVVDDNGRLISANKDERGGITGAKDGDQTGVEVYEKPFFSYSKGWTDILRYPSAPAPTTSNKTIEQLVAETLAGKHGNGDARKKSLGANYAAVQAEINRRSNKSAPAPTASLSKGSKGSRVGTLQRGLNKVFPAYSKLVVDNDFGPATEKVVREFQRRSGLVADGVVGPLTLAALAKHGIRP